MKLKNRYDTEALCRRMLEHNEGTISVRNQEIAIKKLVVIIEAALDLSNKKGLQAMTLRDLSNASGVSMAGLNAYFDSKVALVNLILKEVTFAVEEVLSDPPRDLVEDPVKHLMWLIEAHLRLTEEMLPWFRFSFMEARHLPQPERRMAIDSEELTERYFAQAIQNAQNVGAFRQEVTPYLSTLIKPLLQEWYVKRSKHRRRGVDLGMYIEAVQSFILNSCLPVEQLESKERTIARTA